MLPVYLKFGNKTDDARRADTAAKQAAMGIALKDHIGPLLLRVRFGATVEEALQIHAHWQRRRERLL